MKNNDMFEEFMGIVEKEYKELDFANFREIAKNMKGKMIDMGGGLWQVFSEEGFCCYLLGEWVTYRRMMSLGCILKARRNLRDELGSDEDEE